MAKGACYRLASHALFLSSHRLYGADSPGAGTAKSIRKLLGQYTGHIPQPGCGDRPCAFFPRGSALRSDSAGRSAGGMAGKCCIFIQSYGWEGTVYAKLL